MMDTISLLSEISILKKRLANSVEVVRCKECRFGQWHEQAEAYICIAHDQDLFDGDHFCSYGERSGE